MLQRGLAALAMQQEDLRRCAATAGDDKTDIPAIHVLLVASGVADLSDSMRAYLQELFPAFTAQAFNPAWYDDEGDGSSAHLPSAHRYTNSQGIAVFHCLEPYPHNAPPPKPDSPSAPLHMKRLPSNSAVARKTASRLSASAIDAAFLSRPASRLALSAYDLGASGNAASSSFTSAGKSQSRRAMTDGYSRLCVAPVEIDVTCAIMSQARRHEIKNTVAGAVFHGDRALYVTMDVKRRVYLTLVVRQQSVGSNRNAHLRFFFESFARQSTRICFTRYYLCTAIGTLFEPHALCSMLGHMLRQPKCSVCCGQHRMMVWEDQQEPPLDFQLGREPWPLWLLRTVQTAEVGHRRVFDGMTMRLGVLPEFPGPCLLYRAADVTDNILASASRACDASDTGKGLLAGNLSLVMDRVMATLLILQSPGHTSCAYITALLY